MRPIKTNISLCICAFSWMSLPMALSIYEPWCVISNPRVLVSHVYGHLSVHQYYEMWMSIQNLKFLRSFYAISADQDQSVQKCRLITFYIGHKCLQVGFPAGRLIYVQRLSKTSYRAYVQADPSYSCSNTSDDSAQGYKNFLQSIPLSARFFC